MEETNGVETPLDEQRENSREVRHSNDLMQNYDILGPDQLMDLAEQNTPEAREKLLEIAEKYDLNLDDSLTAREIVDRIINETANEDAPNQYIGTE